ncbi:L,D-transpeptidase/peptidoglycan binding protein [Clostridium swellfunianum]|uniref:L,D-transpeptidase family protein n=1 Tax=Clostridium swellfunianum TaxID=1367462 RepID=UPI00202DDA61|nr:L,D-transpeptidase family protein [Clostridium swellfunianum]MCM0646896.1 L,D-transpeptidase/peptidoglycan binding protein [Clostridium swellfunianum]
MKNCKIKNLISNRCTGNIIIIAASSILIYILISTYFVNHFFFNTTINGVNVSLRGHRKVECILRDSIKNYKLMLIERNEEIEEIIGRDIGITYNEEVNIFESLNRKNAFKWIGSLLKSQQYTIDNLVLYDESKLISIVNGLNCLKQPFTEPQNVSFKYSNGSYEVVKEVYGNKIDRDRLNLEIKECILKGEAKLDLNQSFCYVNPGYTLNSEKTAKTRDLLNKYVKTNITYIFDNAKETLDGKIINQWINVNENLDVIISEIEAMKYLKSLSRKYDTVGIARNFKTSIGKTVIVEGGLYGWKINQGDEIKALFENIKHGQIIQKEPIYSQRSLPRGKDEIGNTYVEINITRQHLWFYKNGRLITQGAVVTGNPNKGHATVIGTYMLNYKQKGATLTGPGYEAGVTYWMPFFGNIGIHDATWRYSFGGEIYKTRGSHGCVNAPPYLAKAIYENIEGGTPIICYEE